MRYLYDAERQRYLDELLADQIAPPPPNTNINSDSNIQESKLVWKDYKYDINGDQIAFSSFRECFEERLMPQAYLIEQAYEKNNPGLHKMFLEKQEFFKKDGLFTYLAQLELDYDCNSMCAPNFFSIHKDMSKGVPK